MNEENNNVTSSLFQVGQRVRARFAGKGHFYNGKITSDNGDGKYVNSWNVLGANVLKKYYVYFDHRD